MAKLKKGFKKFIAKGGVQKAIAHRRKIKGKERKKTKYENGGSTAGSKNRGDGNTNGTQQGDNNRDQTYPEGVNVQEFFSCPWLFNESGIKSENDEDVLAGAVVTEGSDGGLAAVSIKKSTALHHLVHEAVKKKDIKALCQLVQSLYTVCFQNVPKGTSAAIRSKTTLDVSQCSDVEKELLTECFDTLPPVFAFHLHVGKRKGSQNDGSGKNDKGSGRAGANAGESDDTDGDDEDDDDENDVDDDDDDDDDEEEQQGSKKKQVVATTTTTNNNTSSNVGPLKGEDYAHMHKTENWPVLKWSLYALLACHLTVLPRYIQYCNALVGFLQPFPALAKNYLRKLLHLQSWSVYKVGVGIKKRGSRSNNGTDVEVDVGVEDVVESCAAAIESLCLLQPLPFLHEAHKAAYVNFRLTVQAIAANRSHDECVIAVIEKLPLLRQAVAMFYRLEPPSASLCAYVYIRELAVAVEAANVTIAVAHKEGGGRGSGGGDVGGGEHGQRTAAAAVAKVRSFEFMQYVWLWCTVVSENQPALNSLVEPLTRILTAIVHLSAGAMSVPCRLYTARAVQELAACCNMFIPSAWMLTAVLDMDFLYVNSSDSSQTRNGSDDGGSSGGGRDAILQAGERGGNNPQQQFGGLSTVKPPSDALWLVQHLSKDQLHSPAIQKVIMRKVLMLLERDLDLYRYSVACADYYRPVVSCLASALGKLMQGGNTTSAANGSVGDDAGRSGGKGGRGGGNVGNTTKKTKAMLKEWKVAIKALMDRLEKKCQSCMQNRMQLSDSPASTTTLGMLKKMDDVTARKRFTDVVEMEKKEELACRKSGSY